MQIMFGKILYVLLKGLVLTHTKATFTFIPKDYTPSNSLQEESVSICPDLNFTQDISMSEKSDHHILNFKSDRSHSDSTVRDERKVDEFANISIMPESIENNLSKPTSLRAFVQFDSQFTEKVNDIFVTLRWNQPEFDEIIGYQEQCSFFDDFKETCDDKNITSAKLEHTVHNLISNTTYYFRVRAHTKIVAGLYTDLINVSTTHENPIPKLLLIMHKSIRILDVDLNITKLIIKTLLVDDAAYSIQDNRIYWIDVKDLMTLKINENNITKMASIDHFLYNLCIDWVARNLYFIYKGSGYSDIVKFDLTMWENGIIKFDVISKTKIAHIYQLNVSPSMGILYLTAHNWRDDKNYIMQYDFDGKNEQIVQLNSSSCLFYYPNLFLNIIIDDMNNEEPLIYWLSLDHIFVTDINDSMCNTILHKKNINDDIYFKSISIDKTNIYILAFIRMDYNSQCIYVLKKKYASLKSVSNAYKYVEKIIISSGERAFNKIYAFDKSLQPYPPMRCLTPDEKVYNFENVNATANSIIVNLPEPVVKSGCKKYNLPTTVYNISLSCLDNLNKSEKFNVLTAERYYEIHNLTPFTEYKLKFTLSNFYFDQLSINSFDSNVISIKTNSGKPNAPENISVLALTPTIAVVHWIPLEKVNCMAVTYEVHWNSVTLVNGTQQKSKQFINMPKRMADGRYFTKINLSLPVQDYLIYVRVYPINFSDFYNESKIFHIYSIEPNNITLSGVNINSMNISWIPNINLSISPTLEYKDIAAEKWQTMNYIKMNYNNEVLYHVQNLQSGTLYKFRLILRYPEYEENFTWPADERFIFSTLESSLSKPTSLRAFVQFDNQFIEKVNDIFVTLRWNQPEFTDEIILWYQVQCSFFEDFKKICDDKNITATKLEHTVHHLTSNTTYYFRVRAHTKIIAGPYTDLINMSTTHENPVPKLLLLSDVGIEILDVDLNITKFLMSGYLPHVVYSIQDNRIYWNDVHSNLMTLKINKNNITKIATFDNNVSNLCIDWVARNLYFTYITYSGYSHIVKFDLTMWENGIIKFDEIFKANITISLLNVSPSMGILYGLTQLKLNGEYNIIKYHLDGKKEQIVQINSCLFHYKISYRDMIIDDMNNDEPLIYLSRFDNHIFVTDINVSMCNTILQKENTNNDFKSITIGKTNIYILATSTLYVLKKKYANLQSVNAAKYVRKTITDRITRIYAFDKSSQPYPQMKCLTPDEKVYNFENVNATANSIVVNLPEPVVKSGCKKNNLPTTIYAISVSCLDNNLNKSEKFNVQTYERYYEIQNLTPFTEYKLKFTLSNFYFDQLSINPFDSNVISIKTNSGKLNAPENINVLALTPTIAVVHWMPLEKVNCVAVTYEMHWKSVTLVNGTQQEDKQFINVPKRMADGRFFTKINLSLPVQDYLIYVRVYPINFSDFYNESLSKIVHIYSEPNNITLSGVNINSINISWIPNINLPISFTLEYKDITAEKWQTMNYIEMNYNKEVIYHAENLQSGTLYKVRLIMRYLEYEETFIWPADERFIFSTLGSNRGKQMKIPIQHNKVADILKNNLIETLQYCKSIAKLC